jgi:hypothetical protein
VKAKLSNEIWKNCKIYYQKIVKWGNSMEYMDSYYEFKIASSFRKKKYFPKTEDITTTSGYAYLINNDEFQLYKDLEYLRTLESMAFDFM